MKCPHGRQVIDECPRKVYTGHANACQACIDESRQQAEPTKQSDGEKEKPLAPAERKE